MGNVKAKFRGDSMRLDLSAGIKAMTDEQLGVALKNEAVKDWIAA